MLRFIKAVLVFAVILFILDKLLYPLRQVRPCFETEQRLTEVLEGNLATDLLIIGSSRGNKGIATWLLEDSLNVDAYNLSYRGSEVEFHLFLLQQIINSGTPPKTLVKIIDDDFELQFNPTNGFRFDRLYPLVKYPAVRDELAKRGKRNALLNRLSVIHQLGKTRIRLKCSPPPSDSILNYGVVPTDWGGDWDESWTYESERQAYEREEEVDAKVATLQEFQRIALASNINLILAVPPSYKQPSTGFIERIKELTLPGTTLLVYDTNDPVYKQRDYFMDRVHLNEKGANHYTMELVRHLKYLEADSTTPDR